MTSNFLMNSIRLAALAAVTLLPSMACSYSASAPAVGPSGGNIAVQVYTQPGCQWQMTAGAGWLEIFTARSGYGPGTVYVYVAPDRGGAREAYMDVVAFAPPSGNIGGRSSGGSFVAARATVLQY
jgi:hypothetical protein